MKFAEQLNAANGRRRERTISDEEAAEMLSEVSGCCSWDGGRVANSYRYPASTTVVVARVHRGRVYARADCCGATKGGTGCGDVIRGGSWVGPTTAKELKAARFVLIGDAKATA